MSAKLFNRVVFFCCIFSIGFLNAQNSKVRIASTNLKPHYNKLDQAKKDIDLAAIHEKTSKKAKAWKVRGEVYQAIAQSDNKKYKELSEFPLQISFESYKNALELDKKGKYKQSIYSNLKLLGVLMINKAIEHFNKGFYSEALTSFEGTLEIDKIVGVVKIDTIVQYNAAIAAEKALLYDKAIYYYKKTTDLGYMGSSIYGYMANIESVRGDTVKYVGYLKKGIEAYPDSSKDLMVTLIKYYLTNNQSDLALSYLTRAIERDSENPILYFAQGALYDKIEDFNNAKLLYAQAIVLNSNYFDAYFNLGLLYFNRGTDMLQKANNIPPNQQADYNFAVNESFKVLEDAIPYLEKAHFINSDDKTTMVTLRDLYFKLRNDREDFMTKYIEMNQKVINIQ